MADNMKRPPRGNNGLQAKGNKTAASSPATDGANAAKPGEATGPGQAPRLDVYDSSFSSIPPGSDTLTNTFQRSRMLRTPHWAIAWSDLMMTMFIFFVVLYVYQSAHREPEFLGGMALGNQMGSSQGTGSMGTGILGEGGNSFGQGSGSMESISKIYDLSKLVMEKDFAEVASVDLVADKAVRIILAGDLLFDLGRAELKPRAKKSLSKVAELLRQNPYAVNVIGHTDITPIHSQNFPTNWELSTVRACVVARYLIEEMKLPGKRFYVTGHAFYQPVRPNTTAANRATNRRVEIVITKEPPSAQITDITPPIN